MFSKRTSWHQTQNQLSLALEKKKKSSQKYIDLTLSNPTLCSFRYPNNSLFQKLQNPANARYEPDPHGLLSARQAIVRYYEKKNISVSAERIFLTSSTSEAYSALFHLLLDPGGRVLAPKPGYPLFDYLADLSDVRIEKYALREDLGWTLDRGSLEKLGGLSPGALICVNPNNPTGNFASMDEMEFLQHFSIRSDYALISDEVFLDYPWAENLKVHSFAQINQSLTFTISGASKILGLPQMKLSWIVISGPEKLAEEASRRLEVICDAYLSVNTPVQNALPAWLDSGSQISDEILARVRKNLGCLSEFCLANPRVELLTGEGGWHAVLRIKGMVDESFSLHLLEKGNVLVHPGYLFDFPGEDCFVISLLLPSDDFLSGVAALIPQLDALEP